MRLGDFDTRCRRQKGKATDNLLGDVGMNRWWEVRVKGQMFHAVIAYIMKAHIKERNWKAHTHKTNA